MKKKLLSIVLIGVMAASLLLGGCGSNSSEPVTGTSAGAEAGAPSGLVVAIQSDPSGLDPHMVTDRAAGIAIENLYNSLFTYTANYGEVVPSLVDTYDVQDGTVYTLKLKEGVKFHSGNALTSADVKFSLERIQNGGARANQVDKIASIETPDETTVIITLSEEFAPFLTYLANPLNAIVDSKLVEENGGDLTNIDAGSGPFKLVKWNVETSVDMVAFDEYFEEGLPKVESLQLKTITDGTARATALRNGEIHMIIDSMDQENAVLKDAEGVVLETIQGTFWEYLGMNCENEFLKDVAVRQAIAYAIDREAISKAVKMGSATVLKEANIPSSHDYYGGDEIYAARDVEKAKQILEDAGYAEGQIKLEITAGSDWQYQVDAAQMIKQQLGEIGITCEVSALESGVFFDGLNGGDFDMAVCGWSGFVDADEYLYNLFVTDGAYNQQLYSNPDVDKLLEEGRVTVDETARKAIYKDAQKQIAEDAPMAFLYMNSFTVAMRDNVQGYTVHPTASTTFLKDVSFK